MANEKKKKVGRPAVIDEKVLQKLERGFMYGLSDREACLWAGIAPSTLYEYCKEHERFSERKELLKNKPKMKAKIVLAQKINKGDLESAKWYLERKASDEFGTRTTTEVKGGITLQNAFTNLSDEELRQLLGDDDG